MERGKICKMKGKQYFNHQTWHDGRNVVRYVSAKEIEILQSDIDGYSQFMDLVQQYADEIISATVNAGVKVYHLAEQKCTT